MRAESTAYWVLYTCPTATNEIVPTRGGITCE